MKILVVGGGSGGHITPTIAVARELKKLDANSNLIYVIGRGDALSDVITEEKLFTSIHHIFSGKIRRYHGEGLRQLLDLPTLLKNIRDMVFVAVGVIQSWFLLGKIRPDILFIKGGFVGVPIGLAAAMRRIPFVTHDSDALPGLANRVIGRWATVHTVALPKEEYTYDPQKTVQVGVPVSEHYQQVSPSQQRTFKATFGLPPEALVLLVTGGGLGARRVNIAMTEIARKLLAAHPNLAILHLTGRGKDQEITQMYAKQLQGADLERVVVEAFVTDLERYSGAADVVIARAGASTIAELAAQAKACILVPNPLLSGGHQLKNAQILAKQEAVKIVDNESVTKNPELLLRVADELLSNPQERDHLGGRLHTVFVPNAAQKIARILYKVAERKG